VINLNREQLTSMLVNNLALFTDFPVVENYCHTHNSSSGAKAYVGLVREIEGNPELYQLVTQCTHSDFEIDKSNHDFFTGFELATFIKDNSIKISEGESSWIDNLNKIKESLDNGACCSTRKALEMEANFCYSDLISQCDSEWIFIKNIKEFLDVNTITFRLPDNTKKNV